MFESFKLLVEWVSVLAIPLFLVVIPLAAARKVAVYEEFVEGAKEGFQTAIRIIPFVVAILVAIGMFRAAGGVDWIAAGFGPVLAWIGMPSEVFPLALVRPLSGSASLGLFTELVQTHGADSMIATIAGTMMGSTETTFYVLAVYFGAVGVKRSRHALAAGLCADAAGLLSAVYVVRWMVG